MRALFMVAIIAGLSIGSISAWVSAATESLGGHAMGPFPAAPEKSWTISGQGTGGWVAALGAPWASKIPTAGVADGSYCPDAPFYIPVGTHAFRILLNGPPADAKRGALGVATLEVSSPYGSSTRSTSPIVDGVWRFSAPVDGFWVATVHPTGATLHQSWSVTVVAEGASSWPPSQVVFEDGCATEGSQLRLGEARITPTPTT